MKNRIQKIEQDYILTAPDGIRKITWDKESHCLVATLTGSPRIGDVLIRLLTEDEHKEYSRIRRTERNTAKAEKKAAEDKVRKAEEKQVKREQFYARCAEKKEHGRAMEKQTRIFTEVKKLEKADAKAAEPAKTEEPKKLVGKTEIKVAYERIMLLKGLLSSVSDMIDDIKERASKDSSAKDQLRDLKALREEIRGELNLLKEAVKNVLRSGRMLDRAYVEQLENACRNAKKDGPDLNVREAVKVEEKCHITSIPVRNFDSDAILDPEFKKDKNGMYYKPEYADEERTVLTPMSAKLLRSSAAQFATFIGKVEKSQTKPFDIQKKNSTIIHIPVSMSTKELGIDPKDDGVTESIVVLAHHIEKYIGDINWMVVASAKKYLKHRKHFAKPHRLVTIKFSSKKKVTRKAERYSKTQAEEILNKVSKMLYERIHESGGRVVTKGFIGNEYLEISAKKYVPHSASASQLKDEKLVCCEENLRKLHEHVFYFGMTEKEFISSQCLIGPEYYKAMANISRPWLDDLLYEDGTHVKPSHLLLVNPVAKIYHHNKAIQIGGEYPGKKGKTVPFLEGPVDNPVELFAGQIIFWKKLKGFGGQVSGYGLKGYAAYIGDSVLGEFLRRHNLTIEEFMDLRIENSDGKLVRIGDYSALATTDVWKFDKFYPSYEVYLESIKKLEKASPWVGQMSILRQSEDEEGQYKHRHSTRSLLQQFFNFNDKDLNKLVTPSVKRIQKLARLDGMFYKLAELGKNPEDRSPLANMFAVAPFLLMAPGVQRWWKSRLRSMVKDLMANKLDAKGQYPYIIQDPIAMLEIHVLGISPDEAGVLPVGYLSLADVPDGKKVLALRFPANFLTARTQINMSLKDIFADLNNACVLSIHDDILIVQDGDTDGDEMCILYDKLLVELVDRMIHDMDPYVVVFEHGTKEKATPIGTKKELLRRLAKAAYNASHNDNTGKFANLARDCAWLAACAYAMCDDKMVQHYVRYMAAASTGAIISIDQVKGTKVSETLIKWLTGIYEEVRGKMSYKQPYTQWLLKKNVERKDCNDPDTRALPDAVAVKVKGSFSKESGNIKSDMKHNAPYALEILRYSEERTVVKKSVLGDEIKEFLGRTLYNNASYMDKDGKTVEVDAAFKAAVRAGLPVGLKDFLIYLYHNEQALVMKEEGQLLSDKRQAYYEECWKALKKFALSGEYTGKSKACILNSLYLDVANYAFELTSGNGEDDNEGKFSMFCANLVAPTVTKVVSQKTWDYEKFQDEVKASGDDEYAPEDADLEKALQESYDTYGPDESVYQDNSHGVIFDNDCIPEDESGDQTPVDDGDEIELPSDLSWIGEEDDDIAVTFC